MRQWFGSLEGLHIDSWLPLEVVDGHRVVLRPEPPGGPLRLWFINLGAYRSGRFGELHEVAFLVAATGDEVGSRARAALLVGESEQHTDDLHEEVDDIIEVAVAGGRMRTWKVPRAAPPQRTTRTRVAQAPAAQLPSTRADSRRPSPYVNCVRRYSPSRWPWPSPASS
ncbi:MAG: DUF1543 domain-containing protein [bacterium]|nr:DUF1543 domain-containing protein [bacterium]